MNENGLSLPVASVTRDFGTNAAGGRNDGSKHSEEEATKPVGVQPKNACGENRKARKLYSSAVWPSTAYGIKQFGWPPPDMKQFRAMAACSGVGGHQACPVTLIETGMEHRQNSVVHARTMDNAHSRLRFAKCRWVLVKGPLMSVIATHHATRGGRVVTSPHF